MGRPYAATMVLAAASLVVALALGASWWALPAAVAVALVALAGGLHRPRLTPSLAADAPVLLVAALAVCALTSLVVGVVTFAALCAVRAVSLARREPRRTIVVGAGADGRRVARALLARPACGLVPVGFVADTLARGLPLPYLGNDLVRALAETGADTVVSTVPVAAVPGARVYALPALAAYSRPGVERLDGLALVRLSDRPEPAAARVARRLGEGLVALVLLALALPLTVLIALLVRLDTGGVLVREGGALRFRTRRAHSLARPGTTWSVAISGHTGPVGSLLRRTRLDELPHALAVLARLVVGQRLPRRARRRPAVVRGLAR